MQTSVGYHQPLAGTLGLAFIPGQDSGEGRQSSGRDVPVDRTGSQTGLLPLSVAGKTEGLSLVLKVDLEGQPDVPFSLSEAGCGEDDFFGCLLTPCSYHSDGY